MSAPEYKIGGLADFLRVPPERLSACLTDFSTWISMMRDEQGIVGLEAALASDGLPGKMMSDRFTWCDDGIQGISAVDFVSEGEYLGRLKVQP
jgi:hypothetical protein